VADSTLTEFVAAHADGALVIDVREPMEYRNGHVPGALLIPMGQLPSRHHELPHNAPVYLICASGNRSSAMAAYLIGVGVDARSVQGGTSAWAAAGHPVVIGNRANVA
jgi:rhodanese-related sulfurtransferase